MKIKQALSNKQIQAFKILQDTETIEFLYGGGAGGGKSVLGCVFILKQALNFPETRYLIGRESLEDLKKTTLLTFFWVCKQWGMKVNRDYVFNQQDKFIEFRQTGSRVYYSDLAFWPSDVEYDYLGSTEYTDIFVDEASQITAKCREVLRTRCRYKTKEYGIIGKIFMTCNPSKGHLYVDFYKPDKEGKLPQSKKFLRALVTDNPFIDDNYIKNLEGLQDKAMKARLLLGDWEYDDDPSALMNYDLITDIFTNTVQFSTDKYLVCDVARKGKDMTTISYWEGYDCKRIAGFKKLLTVPDPNNPQRPSTAGKLQEWMRHHQVQLSHVIVDEDGVGGGVRDYLGCKGFVAQQTPFKNPKTRMPENYANVKAQCGWALAKKVNAGELAVRTTNPTIKKMLIEDLEQVKQKDADKDGKLALISKDIIKKITGRSPDFGDLLIMRFYFDYLPRPNIQWITI